MHGGFRWTAATVRSERIRAVIPNGRWLTAFASEAGRLVPLPDAKIARDRFRAAASGAVRQSD